MNMKEHEMIPTVLSIIIVVMGLGLNLTTNITTNTTNQTSGVATPLDPMGQIMKQMQSDNKTD
jgi:hypothetical protein